MDLVAHWRPTHYVFMYLEENKRRSLRASQSKALCSRVSDDGTPPFSEDGRTWRRGQHRSTRSRSRGSSTLIWGFIKVRQAAKALRAMDNIEGAGLTPDVKTYNALIDALCKAGEVDRAFNVFDGMIVEPDVITYTTILDGLCKGGKLEKALNVLDNMKVEPDVITYTTILDGLCKGGMLEQALNVLDRGGMLEQALNVLENMKVKPYESGA